MDQFTYLWVEIFQDREVLCDVRSGIAKAARAFGCLRKSVFFYGALSVAAKRCVYLAVVLSVLWNRAETWTLMAKEVRKLNSFHNVCEDHLHVYSSGRRG